VRKTLGVVLFTAAGMIPLRVTATPAQGPLSAEKALFLMRLAISTEAALASNTNGYGNLIDVVKSPDWPDASQLEQFGLPAMEIVDSNSAQGQGYLLRITASDDKRHFQASLEPIDPKTCDRALFGDDRGLIYGGKVLGCPASGLLR
jgi:hypothetical protein